MALAGMKWLCSILGAIIIVATEGIRLDKDVSNGGSGTVHLTGHISLGTFNTLLYRGAQAFEERKEKLIKTLQDQRENKVPDILCLQEVFRRSDARDIVDAMKHIYPYYASLEDLDNDPAHQPACLAKESHQLEAFRSCLQHCSSGSGTGLNNCSVVNCRAIFSQLSLPCRSCVVLERGSFEDSVADAYTRCSSTIPATEYTAAHGVLLLSRYPLSNVTTKDFLDFSYVFPVPRGYVAAEIDSYSFLCTHLQAEFRGIVYGGPSQFDSYEEQQANEVKEIHRFVESSTRNVVLMGDFNHGPAIPRCEAELPLNYGLMTSVGLFSVAVMWSGQCTYCSRENPLASDLDAVSVIDHIYLCTSKASAVVHVERMFDTIRIPGPVQLPLSDHYGVRAVLDFTKMNKQHWSTSHTCESSINFLQIFLGIDPQVCPSEGIHV